MAKIITTDGLEIEVSPKNGTDFSLEEMQKVVGGYIEMYHISDMLMVINEEGKLYGLPYNEKATKLFRESYKTDDFIVGNVLVCDNNQIK